MSLFYNKDDSNLESEQEDVDESSTLFTKMSLMDRVKKSLKKKTVENSVENSVEKSAEIIVKDIAEETIEEETCEQEPELEEEHLDFEESFNFYEKKWVIAPFMSEIRKGDLEKIPIECMFSHYILFSRELHCYYVGLQNHESGDEYEIYEFDWVGESEEPEFKEISQTINAIDSAKFLAERISDGYFIYIPEREIIDE